MTNKMLWGRDSRYYSVDDYFWVFTTPNEVLKLDIGFDIEPYRPGENAKQPFVVDILVEMAREYILGTSNNGHYLRWPVEGVTDANCFVTICLEINSKLCMLQSEEVEKLKLPIKNQVKTFQRLINERRITLDDLSIADIDLGVYKQLYANEVAGDDMFGDFLLKMATWIKEGYESKEYRKYYKDYEGTEKLNSWLELAEG